MAGSYDLRSQDQDTSSYAALPGTDSDFVTHNMTPMKSNLAPGREIVGCHPSRWIYELIHNNFTVCDMFHRARQAKLDAPYTWQQPHRLVLNGNQTYSTSSSQVVSSISLDCHFHFVFKLSWQEEHADERCHPRSAGWPVRDNQFPWHHLVWAGSDSDPKVAQDHTKYYPLLARERFFCSAGPCTFQIVLEVSEPRMPSWWVQLLLDHDAIREELQRAKEREPSRYEAATDDWAYQAPLNINTYLKNLLESAPEDVRSISKRNKRFAVLFGPRCFSIFRALEFSEKINEVDGIDEGIFTPLAPTPPGGPDGTTELGSYRAFIEDVRAEVQCLIHKAGQTAERPTYIGPALHSDLLCQEVPNVASNALVNTERYRLLGVLPHQSREIIVNAYKRQWELLPSQRRDLVESLMAIANDSRDELLSDYAATQSSVFDSQVQTQSNGDDDGIVSQALTFLGLRPPNNYSSESLIKAFRQKLRQDSASASTARQMLMMLAQWSRDDSYQAALLMEADSKMSLATAQAVLDLDTRTESSQQVVEILKSKLQKAKSPEETEIYLDAMDAIADHTDTPFIKQVVIDLRSASGIIGPSGSNAASGPVDWTLPVGLYNIGNTCYLNSLLQYLFTVKPIRDIVLNYEDVRLELTDESIEQRRLGGNKMHMDRGEAVVAQAFVEELATLFRNLQSSDQASTRPSQRLANAVLLSTHTLLDASKQPSEAPPLPARPVPPPPVETNDDIDMVSVTANPFSEASETASHSSSQTLVDNLETSSDNSFEKVEKVVELDSQPLAQAINTTSAGDTEMEQGQEADDGKVPTAKAEGQEAPASPAHLAIQADTTKPEEPETVDQKVLNALEHQKRSSGTDQQDVEEVMGSIINRLQAAIRPSSIDERTGIQLEKIMETFFVTTVNYTKKFDETEYQTEISFDRSITAFPASEGPCSLYDALGRNFDQQILEESKLSRYTAIKTLPPVLHVLIQRSQSMGSKNGNAVVIPETLYLDRYMDAAHDSPVFKRRVQDWMTANRVTDLKTQLANVDSNPSYLSFFENYGTLEESDSLSGSGDSSVLVNTPEENWDFDGPVEEDFLLISSSNQDRTSPPAPVPKLANIRETDATIRQMMEDELVQREQAIEQHLEGMKEIPYRLHAVICHRGHLSSGHYWVWIHDFEDNVWRWYNDSDVKENKDTAEVLNTLSTSGEPYYLCYVRDEDKDTFVNVPKRQQPDIEDNEEVTQDAAQPVSTTVPIDADGDISMVDKEAAAPMEEVSPPAQAEFRID